MATKEMDMVRGTEIGLISTQRELFILNRMPLNPHSYSAMYAYEENWVARLWQTVRADEDRPIDYADFRSRIETMSNPPQAALPASVDFLAQQANRAQFTCMIEHFALDRLTEAQSFLPILPRLPFTAQMPLMRILIDEFGCGNLQHMHSHLYAKLLAELGADANLDRYVEKGLHEVFEFVNIFHWMTKRTQHVEYFLGALAWFESVLPSFFAPYVAACERLEIREHTYFTEHIHIDSFHAQNALLACREIAKIMPFDYARALQGARLAESITDRAFEEVVNVARTVT
jgi:hypothetical protein